MSDHSATIELRDDDNGRRAVVTDADTVIWIADELMTQATNSAETITGGLERDGDLIRFGTVGEGLGRFTYRLTGREHNPFSGEPWHVAELIEREA